MLLHEAIHSCYLLFVLVFVACKKESISPVVVPPGAAAVFAPLSAGVICANTVGGIYQVGTALDTSNKVTLQVEVTSPGSYVVATDKINGISFYDSGRFVSKGKQNIVLKGSGTPAAAGLYAYLFTAGSSSCRFTVASTNQAAPLADNDHLLFGNPSNAAPLEDSAENYLLRKTWYALSYNRTRGTPNWVSWHLYTADVGQRVAAG